MTPRLRDDRKRCVGLRVKQFSDAIDLNYVVFLALKFAR